MTRGPTIPWPPPSAVAVRHLHDLATSVVLRHTADLYWTSHLPDPERDQVLDHMAMHDLRHSPGEQLARLRAEQALLTDLAAFHHDHPTAPAGTPARREGIRPRAPRRRPPRIPHLHA